MYVRAIPILPMIPFLPATHPLPATHHPLHVPRSSAGINSHLEGQTAADVVPAGGTSGATRECSLYKQYGQINAGSTGM